MLFGPHDRLFPLQMFQTLLSLVEFQVWCNLVAWLLLLGLKAVAVFGTRIVDIALSWPAMALVALYAGQRLCPFADPPPRRGYERPPRYRGTPAAPLYLVGSAIWFPILLELVLATGLDHWFDSGYGFVMLLVALQWWAMGIAISFETLRCTLEPPPPWPDPPFLMPIGYTRRWCTMTFPRHHCRYGQVSTYYFFDFPEHAPFVVGLLGCWIAFAACLLGGMGDVVASMFERRQKGSECERGSCPTVSSSASSDKTASSPALPDTTAPVTAVPVMTPLGPSRSATLST